MRFKAKLKIALEHNDEIEFSYISLSGRVRTRIGIVQGLQNDKNCPYVVGFYIDEDEDQHEFSIEEQDNGWATYGMRMCEFIRLIHRPRPE